MEDKTDEEVGGPLKCIPNKWTIWDRLEIKRPKTCQQFYDDMFKQYGIKIDILVANGVIIMSSLDEESLKKNINKKIEDLYLSMAKVKPKENINYILLQLSASIDKVTIKNKELNDVAVEMPPIKYIFK